MSSPEANLYQLFGLTEYTSNSPEKPAQSSETEKVDLYALDFGSAKIETKPEKKTDPVIDAIARIAAASSVRLKRDIEPQAVPLEEESYPELESMVDNAITKALADPVKYIYYFHELISLTTNQIVTKQQKDILKSLLKTRPELSPLGNSRFGISDRLTPDNFWPGKELDRAFDNPLKLLADSILETYILPPGTKRKVNDYDIQRRVQRFQLNLTKDEFDELSGFLFANDRVIPIPDSSDFYVKSAIAELEITELDRHTPYIPPKKISHGPLGTFQIRSEIRRIEKSPEFKKARELAKNYADPRKYHKKIKPKDNKARKTSGGKGQGKKVSIEQLIANMNKQDAPFTTPLQ